MDTNLALCPCPFSVDEWFVFGDLFPADSRAEWENLLHAFNRPYGLYQSPEWFEHQQSAGSKDQFILAGAKDETGSLSGIVPLAIGNWKLDYSVKVCNLWRTNLRCVHVLGSQPLVPPDARKHDNLFRLIYNNFPHCDCILMRMTPVDSFLYNYLHQSKFINDHFLRYTPDGFNTNHFISLPQSFDEYLAKFSSKKRYNLKRQIRLLRDHAGGDLSMRRIEQSKDVPFFLDCADFVARRSWQGTRSTEELIENSEKWRRKLIDLAERGLLRSYLLFCADKPCAYVLGYQFEGVFHYVQVGYDQGLEKHSPGIALLYMLIEDLIAHNKASLLTFGFGDNNYKQEFGNLQSRDVLMVLLRKNGLNRSRRFFHSTFSTVSQSLKKRLPQCKSYLSFFKRLSVFRSGEKRGVPN